MDINSLLFFLGAGAMQSYWILTLSGTVPQRQQHACGVDSAGNLVMPVSQSDQVGGYVKISNAGTVLESKVISTFNNPSNTFMSLGTIVTPEDKILVFNRGALIQSDYAYPSVTVLNSSGTIEGIFELSMGSTGFFGLCPVTEDVTLTTVNNYNNSGQIAYAYNNSNFNSVSKKYAQRYSTGAGYWWTGATSIPNTNDVDITAFSPGGDSNTSHFVIARFNKNTNAQVWAKTFSLSGSASSTPNYSLFGYTRLSNDTVVQMYGKGSTTDPALGTENYLLFVYPDGTIKRTYSSFNTGNGEVVKDSADNVYVVNNNWTSSNSFIYKFNADGVIQWKRSMSNTRLRSLALLDDNTFYVTGSTNANAPFAACLPTDGSLTGTYGSFTYASTSDGFANASTLSTSNHTNTVVNLSTGLAGITKIQTNSPTSSLIIL